MTDSAPLPDPSPSAGRPRVRTARAKPAEVVLVCRKCARRLGLPAKAARRLARDAAKRALGADAGSGRPARKAKVVETGCLGPCPKRLLAVATGAGLAAGRVALLDPRADPPVALPDISADRGPDFGPNAALPAASGADARSGGHGSAHDSAPIQT